MSIKFWNFLLVLALLATLAGGGYILQQNYLQKQMEIQQAEEEAARLRVEEAREAQALKVAFDEFLESFLQNLEEEAEVYKKRRTVLLGLAKPSNMRAPEYIEENARLADSTFMALQLQMDKILGLFKAADEQAQPLIAQFEEVEAEAVRASWRDLQETQAEQFMNYFKKDQDVLLVYRDLIEFYDAKKDVLNVDVISERVVFDSLEDQEHEALLRGKIVELKSRQ